MATAAPPSAVRESGYLCSADGAVHSPPVVKHFGPAASLYGVYLAPQLAAGDL